jgi:site-specific DNA-methyltransferase (adenine-specific)
MPKAQPHISDLHQDPRNARKHNERNLDMIFHDDCFIALAAIADGSVDMIFTDPPYGTTNLHWDTAPDLVRMFAEFNRVIKKNGAIVVTAQQPFATDCINANRKYFRYEWIWEKTQKQGFFAANKMPLRAHENVLVFYKALPTYNPQKSKAEALTTSKTASKKNLDYSGVYTSGSCAAYRNNTLWQETGLRFPSSVVKINNWNGALFGNTKNATKHPTQKPLALFEYFIRTYTNEGETVLDCFAGSGTTAVAAINTGRKYIVVEKEQKYVDIIRERVAQAEQTLFAQAL